MSKTLRSVSAALCVLVGLTGCADTGESRAKRVPSIQTAQDLQAKGRYLKYTDVAFFAGGIRAKIIGASVSFYERDYQRHDGVSGNTAYFEATVWPKKDTSRGESWVLSPVLEGWSKEDLAQAYADLQAGRKSQRIAKIATDFAGETICAAGSITLDDRKFKQPVPLTPAQNAKVLHVVGGNFDRLLGMTPQDMEQLGIGFLIDRSMQASPNLRYETHKKTGQISAKIRLKCVF